MKNEKKYITRNMLIVSLAVCISVIAAFNILMNQYIKKNVTDALNKEVKSYKEISIQNESEEEKELQAESFDDDSESSTFSVSVSFVPQSLIDGEKDVRMRFSDEEIAIVNELKSKYEFKNIDKKNGTAIKTMTVANKNYYYIVKPILNAEWKYLKDDGTTEPTVLLLYINTSSLNSTVRVINIMLACITVVFSLLSLLVGHITGKRIEEEKKNLKLFFQNASHELKTPLMSITGYAEGIEQNVIDSAEGTKIIISESEKMSALVNDILNLSKIDSNQVDFAHDVLNVKELIYSAKDPLVPEGNKKDITFEITADDDIYVLGDYTQLTKAFSNVMSNALRYAKSLITIICTTSENEIKVTIIDDGNGISEEDMKHIFDRFYSGKGGNTGIGLALTEEIVLAHKGNIVAENTETGAAFTIALPKAKKLNRE